MFPSSDPHHLSHQQKPRQPTRIRERPRCNAITLPHNAVVCYNVSGVFFLQHNTPFLSTLRTLGASCSSPVGPPAVFDTVAGSASSIVAPRRGAEMASSASELLHNNETTERGGRRGKGTTSTSSEGLKHAGRQTNPQCQGVVRKATINVLYVQKLDITGRTPFARKKIATLQRLHKTAWHSSLSSAALPVCRPSGCDNPHLDLTSIDVEQEIFGWDTYNPRLRDFDIVFTGAKYAEYAS